MNDVARFNSRAKTALNDGNIRRANKMARRAKQAERNVGKRDSK